MIKLTANKFITHKKGETLSDCQDAAEFNEDEARYAVADGATRSFFPKMWADLLVKNFCEETTLSLEKQNWKGWITSLQQKWLQQAISTVQETERFISIDRLSRSESAAATFVGLEIDRTQAEWKAMIIGDSCLFHIEDGELKEIYLIKKSEHFTNRPEVFASFAKDSSYEPTFVKGQINAGDMFILATDALAKWIIQHAEAGKLEDGLKHLIRIDRNKQQFDDFVEKARETEGIHLANDDVTLMLISVKSDQKPRKVEPAQELAQQNPWSVLFVCLLAGGGMLVGLCLVFYFLLKSN